MEGIFICAALHCLKSFIKQTDLVAHIHELHPDLIQSDTKKEAIHSHSSTDTHKESITQETSTACAPPQPGLSVSAYFRQQNRDERTHSQQFNDYPSTVELQHLRFMQADNLPQGSDMSNAWMNLSQDMSQAGPQIQQVSNQSFTQNHGVNPLQLPLQPNYQLPVNPNQAMLPPAAVSYHLSTDGSQQFYSMPYQLPNPEQLQTGGPVQGSVLGFSPAPGGIATFAGNGPRPWLTSQMVVPMDPSVILAQGSLQGYTNLTDAQRNSQISGGWLLNQPQIGQDSKLHGVSAVDSDSNGVFAQQLQQPGSLQIQHHR